MSENSPLLGFGAELAFVAELEGGDVFFDGVGNLSAGLLSGFTADLTGRETSSSDISVAKGQLLTP